jgi:NYN domain
VVEKMTDVKIAVRLVEDAIDHAFDRAYIVSGDVDLLPAIQAALRRNGQCQIVLLWPPETIAAEELPALEKDYPGRAVARPLDPRKLRRFPDDLPTRWGMSLPAHWKQSAGRRPVALDAQRISASSRQRLEWFEESVSKCLARRYGPGLP